ncbi:acyl-CoA dehydrogenase [Rubrivirga sp. S365]|uniref:Acyl-coenzyme A dehydrogenase n=1 Tax=Rubrivirga litoralis TaxID=3075598 RepID=A0ABU3BSW5_9BACT|nr:MULTISPECIES: acyl-CoA dehydrogenase [unclassified Rubrivirga]MDT0632256.1 acyl-CoA dehydrogenase [Rubrivirga sp. F394]MDT7856382.1 acyl-CoA dehydrogenase [Rubrivirga sp. S365]
MDALAFFAGTPVWAAVLGVLLVLFALGFTGAPLWAWAAAGLVALVGFGAPLWLTAVFVVLAAVFLIPPIRRQVSLAVMKAMKALNFLPVISRTEQEAIDAGTVWVEGELFSGKPDFERIMAQPYAGLTEEEQAFLDGPVEDLCQSVDDWEVWQRRDLPESVWQKLRDGRFFGLIVPKEYGGHGFSPSANSAIVSKASSVSSALGITVMVPNSLGPAELLAHFGTPAQKDHWLPKLATGEAIPAFALTEPGAGSDAGAISSRGTVFRGDDGDLYLRLNWRKRYITLAAISDVLGLAFKLDDPDNLLGKGTDLGITCALVPSDTEGVVLGQRHDPLGVPFWNCPTEGHDVVVKLEDAVIGGAAGAGRGWTMLMQSLAAGRGISLPASATAGIKQAARVAGAHALIRKQFGLSIGKFEGIEEPLARIGGWAYMMEAARRYTCGGLDQGAAPAVVTAMMKYNTTELFRKGINDAMDVLGGNAISRGPRNPLAAAYIGTPVSITVEGANILTRTLMVFGQGAIRCHPYALKEMQALMAWDVRAFDAAFWPHIGHVVRNGFRAVGLSLSRGLLAGAPVGGAAAGYWRKLSWSSATFAFLADLAMGTLGGDLKRKEKLTGRFADVFMWMYFGAAVLRRYEAEGRLKEDEPFMRWSMDYAFAQIQDAFDGLFANLAVPGATWLFRGPIAAWSRFNRLAAPPSDRTGHRVAAAMQVPGEQRDRLFGGVFSTLDPDHTLGRFEHTMRLAYEAEGVVSKVKAAIRSGALPKAHPATLIPQAVEDGVLTPEEAALLQRAEEARNDAIQVDSFTTEEYFESAVAPDEVGGDGQATGDGLGDGAAPPVGAVGFGGPARTDAGASTWTGAVVTEDPAAEDDAV